MRTFAAPALLMLLLLSSVVQAQNTRLIAGKIAYENQDYPKAWEALNDALAKPDLLKEKQVLDARLLRIETAYRLQIRPEGRPEGLTDTRLADVAWADWEAVRNADVPAYRMESVRSEAVSLAWVVAMGEYNAGNYAAARQRMERMVDDATDIPQFWYYLGICRQQEGAYGEAIAALERALAEYASQAPAEPIISLGYAYYQIAMMQRYFLPDFLDAEGTATTAGTKAALQTADQGLAWAHAEKARVPSLPVDTWEQLVKDLQTMRLDCLLQLPGREEEAMGMLETALKKDPANTGLLLAQASLMENAGMVEEARGVYQAIVDKDPDQLVAWFNLGALFVNEAAQIYRAANALDDFDEADAMTTQANEVYSKAQTPMENVLRLDPGNSEAIRMLMDISLRTGDEEAYKKYKAMQDQ